MLKWTHGPSFEEGGIRFRLWAPKEAQIGLVIEGYDPIAMTPNGDGFFEVFVNGLSAGARYMFALSSGRRVPDPASRFQPDDVNGPSEAVDPRSYRWRESWKGREWDEIVLTNFISAPFPLRARSRGPLANWTISRTSA